MTLRTLITQFSLADVHGDFKVFSYQHLVPFPSPAGALSLALSLALSFFLSLHHSYKTHSSGSPMNLFSTIHSGKQELAFSLSSCLSLTLSLSLSLSLHVSR